MLEHLDQLNGRVDLVIEWLLTSNFNWNRFIQICQSLVIVFVYSVFDCFYLLDEIVGKTGLFDTVSLNYALYPTDGRLHFQR